MTRKNEYAVPECELLEMELEKDFLGESTFNQGDTSAESLSYRRGEWD
jgi:hypothetical protein